MEEIYCLEKPYFPYYKVYWDQALLTDKTVHFNRSYLTLVVKINGDVSFKDIAVPLLHALQATAAEIQYQYQELQFH